MLKPEDIDVIGVWHGENLYWEFSYGLLTHEISEKDLKSWLNTKSGIHYYELPHDSIIRAKHTNAYINKELLKI